MGFLKLLLPTALGFIQKYLTVGLILLLVLSSLYGYWQKTRYERTAQQIEAIKHDYAQAALARTAENEFKLKIAYHENEILTKVHTSEINKVKVEYEKINKVSNLTITTLRNQLRDKVRSSPVSVSEIASDTERTAEAWRNDYATIVGQYNTLVEACKITTADYNALRQYSDNNCMLFGCE